MPGTWLTLSHTSTAQGVGSLLWPCAVMLLLTMLLGITAFGAIARCSYREGNKMIAYAFGSAAVILAVGFWGLLFTVCGVGT